MLWLKRRWPIFISLYFVLNVCFFADHDLGKTATLSWVFKKKCLVGCAVSSFSTTLRSAAATVKTPRTYTQRSLAWSSSCHMVEERSASADRDGRRSRYRSWSGDCRGSGAGAREDGIVLEVRSVGRPPRVGRRCSGSARVFPRTPACCPRTCQCEREPHSKHTASSPKNNHIRVGHGLDRLGSGKRTHIQL